MSQSQIPIKIRIFKETDKNFIFSSWLQSNRGTRITNLMTNDVYYNHHSQLIEYILTQDDIKLSVVCSKDDDDHLYGYSCMQMIGDQLVIHYIYIKYPYRGFGLAKKMLFELAPSFNRKETLITHIPRDFESMSKKYKLVFNPYILFGVVYDK